MRVVDDPEAYKPSKAEATAAPAKVRTPSFVSVGSSLAKSAKKKKFSKSEGDLTVTFPVEGFAYLDPSFVKDLSEALLLSTDYK